MLDVPTQLLATVERLIEIALDDTGQSRRVANFLLAWWNASECGGFDPTDLWSVDTAIERDILSVMAFLGNNRVYPDSIGFERQFQRIVRLWRPELVQ